MLVVKEMFTYSLRGPLGEPLFQVLFTYRSRPWMVLESCTTPGTLTRHTFKYPLPDTGYEDDFRSFLENHAPPSDNPHYTDLYNFFAQEAIGYLDDLPKKYTGSVAHKKDHAHYVPSGYLTTDQRKALEAKWQGSTHPWEDVPSYQKVLAQQETRAKQKKREAKNAPPVYPTEDYKYFEGLVDKLDFIFTEQEIKLVRKNASLGLFENHWTVLSESVDAFLLARAAALHSDRDDPVYTPAQLELYMMWPEYRRLRWVNEIKHGQGPGEQVKPWEYDTPYLWDTPDAREWADRYYDLLPKNWDDLPADLQFDPQTPENYR